LGGVDRSGVAVGAVDGVHDGTVRVDARPTGDDGVHHDFVGPGGGLRSTGASRLRGLAVLDDEHGGFLRSLDLESLELDGRGLRRRDRMLGTPQEVEQHVHEIVEELVDVPLAVAAPPPPRLAERGRLDLLEQFGEAGSHVLVHVRHRGIPTGKGWRLRRRSYALERACRRFDRGGIRGQFGPLDENMAMTATAKPVAGSTGSSDAHPRSEGDSWFDVALEESEWIKADPSLAALAASLRRHNGPIRRAAAARSQSLLGLPRRREQITRVAAVSVELTRQLGGLGFDLRRTARDEKKALPAWLLEQRRRVNEARRRLAVEGFDPEARSRRLAAEAAAGGDPLRETVARRLRLATEALGPTFVKFGQVLGSAEGLLPAEFVAEFGRCRDEVRPEASDVVVREVERSLGHLTEVFQSFDPRPLAAASIAQVHAATLADGREVVVKVQRPGVRRVMERDISVLHAMATAIEQIDLLSTANLTGMVEMFAGNVLEELDFRLEAENMIAVALSLESAGATQVVVPRPIPGSVTPTVLVMERLRGTRLHDSAATGQSPDEALAVLRTGTQAVLESALEHGLFHGDLHAGNMLLLDDGRYGLLDFGIVGRFDPAQRRGLWEWIGAMLADDLGAQLRSLQTLGAFPAGTDLEAVAAGLESELSRVEQPQGDSSFDEVAAGFERIARILQASGMRIPKELSLFLKNLMHVNGSLRVLAPERDPYAEVGEIFGNVTERRATPG